MPMDDPVCQLKAPILVDAGLCCMPAFSANVFTELRSVSPGNGKACAGLRIRKTKKLLFLSLGALGMWAECLLDMGQCVELEPDNKNHRDRALDLIAFAEGSQDMLEPPEHLLPPAGPEGLKRADPILSQLL